MPKLPSEDKDKLAETDKDIFLECAERFRLASEAENENRLEAIKDLEFADGQQWPSDLYNQRNSPGFQRPTLTINHTNTFVRRVVNNLRQQRPRIKCHPVGEGAQVEDAKVINGLVRHIETLSKASVAYDTGGESAVRIGWGYWRILGEYIDEKSFEQELKIVPVRNTFTGYIDPSSKLPDGSDMDWFIFSEQMSRIDYERKYPEADKFDWGEGGPGDASYDWDSKENIRLAEYYRICKKKETLYQLSDGRTMFKSELPSEDGLAAAKLTILNQRPSYRRQVEWFKINGSKIIDRRVLPGQWIPVIRCEGNVLDLNGKVRRKGMIRDLKDPARMYNYWRSAATEKTALSTKAPWIGAEGQFDGHPEWNDANQKPYAYLQYKIVVGPDGITPLPPPQRTPAVEVDAAFIEGAQSAEHDLLAVAGMPHEPAQDAPGVVVSGKALRQRQALSDIGHFQYYDNQTMAINHTGRILVDYIPYYYSEERMQRILGEDGVPSMIKINEKVMDPQTQAVQTIKNDLTVGRYDVVMDTGPGYETKRQENAELMVDVLKIGPLAEVATKTGADLIFRSFEMDEMADRLVASNPAGLQKAIQEMPKEAQGIVQSLVAENNQLKQSVQNLQLEIKYKSSIEQGWQQVELTKAHLGATTKAHDTETMARVKVHDTEVKATTARDVEEIKAGAQLLNMHVEAEHERKAAKEVLAHAEKAESSSIQ